MIVIVVHHVVGSDAAERAARRIRANTDRMLQAPGLVFRYELRPSEEPVIVTITAWRDEESLRAWDSLKPLVARGPDFEGPSPFESVRSERFDDVYGGTRLHPRAKRRTRAPLR